MFNMQKRPRVILLIVLLKENGVYEEVFIVETDIELCNPCIR